MKYGPNDLAGRDFKPFSEGFEWYTVTDGLKLMFCKMDSDNYVLAKQKQPFEVWHMCAISKDGIAPLCTSSKTLEPWLINQWTAIAPVHPDLAKDLESFFEEITRTVVIATKMPDAPVAGKNSKLELI